MSSPNLQWYNWCEETCLSWILKLSDIIKVIFGYSWSYNTFTLYHKLCWGVNAAFEKQYELQGSWADFYNF